ncbi:hypothetical protein FRC12_012412 [Ceratobasidium sp. 428]|nr:hypothetical protein FRC12_012412 [Ceratobasidium sp. 428]
MPKSLAPHPCLPLPLPHPYQPMGLMKARQPNMTFKQRLEVAEFYHANPHLTIEQMVPLLNERGYTTVYAATIKRCVDREAENRAYVESGGPSRLNDRHQAVIPPPEVEAALLEWLKERQQRGIYFSTEMICEKARQLRDQLGAHNDPRLKFSRAWFNGFKQRHGLVLPSVTYYGALMPERKTPSRKKSVLPSDLEQAPPRHHGGLQLASAPLLGYASGSSRPLYESA